MEDLLLEYESFEHMSMEVTVMTSQMDDLLDAYDGLTVLHKLALKYSSESAQTFINQKFSLEADINTSEDPTTGGNATSKQNKDGKNEAATGKSIWNRLSGLKSRIADAFKYMQRKCIEFWNKVVSYAAKLFPSLEKLSVELEQSKDDLNVQVNGVCEDINNVQLTPVMSQIQGTNSKDELAKVMGNLNSNLESKTVKEPQTVGKENFISKFIKPHIDAIKRVASGSERKAASTAFESTAKQTEKAKDNEELNLLEKKANASMSASNSVIGYIFRSAARLFTIAKSNKKKNG